MALDARYITAISLEEYFVDKDTGLPLANGTIEFWEDDSRTTPKAVFQLTGAPPNYTYTPLPNPIVLSGVGTVVDANGNNVDIYYYPYDAVGNIQLYYVVVKNSLGVVQFIRQAQPSFAVSSINPDVDNVIVVTTSNVALQSGKVYICANGANLITFTLPNTAVQGAWFTIIGESSGGYQIVQNALQVVHMGNQSTTIGAGGSLAVTNRRDCITLRCTVIDTAFSAYAAQGNFTIV